MNRRGLILSVLALGAAGFGGATWFANRPGPVAEAVGRANARDLDGELSHQAHATWRGALPKLEERELRAVAVEL